MRNLFLAKKTTRAPKFFFLFFRSACVPTTSQMGGGRDFIKISMIS